jgi:hypothetical protein
MIKVSGSAFMYAKCTTYTDRARILSPKQLQGSKSQMCFTFIHTTSSFQCFRGSCEM